MNPLTPYLPLIIAALGAILYLVTDKKAARLGEIAFAIGLFCWLFGGAK